MADLDMDVQGLIDYSIVFSQSEAESLFEDIKYDMAKKDFKEAGKKIFNYQINIYNTPVDQLPYDADGYAECLEEIYDDYPFDVHDIDNYEKDVEYENTLALKLAEIINKKNLALDAARLIKEDMRSGNIQAAADIIEDVSDLSRTQLVLKLGNIAAQLVFFGESENELDDF